MCWGERGVQLHKGPELQGAWRGNSLGKPTEGQEVHRLGRGVSRARLRPAQMDRHGEPPPRPAESISPGMFPPVPPVPPGEGRTSGAP